MANVMKKSSDWFEETWRDRDEVLYPKFFSRQSDRSIVTIPYAAFAQLGVNEVDPRWLHCGVLTFPPSNGEQSFTFATSGLSSAWDAEEPDSSSVSGLGVELRVDSGSNEPWVKDVLLRVSAMQLLIGAGYFENARILIDGDRIRVAPETFGDASVMTALLVTKIADFQLLSGKFSMMQLFPISNSERDLATAHGSNVLLSALQHKTTYPVSDVRRASIV